MGPITFVRTRIRHMARRAVLKAVKDSLEAQQVQIALGEQVLGQVERIQEYGLTSRAHPGAEAIMLRVGGDPGHPLVVAVGDRRYRLTELAPGEVALYDDQGQVVHLQRDKMRLSTGGTGNPIELATDGPATVNAGGDATVTASGALKAEAGGDATITAGGNITAEASDGDATVSAGGKAVVDAAAVELGGAGGQVVTTAHKCAYTGNPHPEGSSVVSAGV